MGGDNLPCPTFEDELSLLDYDILDYPSQFSYRNVSRIEDEEDESLSGSYEFVYKGFDENGDGISSNSVEFDENLRRKIAYNEIMRNYEELWTRKHDFHQAKSRILSYKPGSWIINAGRKKLNNYEIPKTSTLLLIGPKGSGKSSLINRISRVFEDDKFASQRAQVTYNPSNGEGTYFLQEYMIPRYSSSFCLFDTRSLSENFADNDQMLQSWMTNGVRHGELVIRDSDAHSLKMSLKCKAQQSGTPSNVIRKVNFVIFVVNGFQVLQSINSNKKQDRLYMDMVVKTFSSPYLSYKDDKPVVVVTHCDLLSLGDRVRVRVHLGEKLGIPPAKQIFDIPDDSDPSDLMIVDMIRYCLEHADKNIPGKELDWVDKSTSFLDGVKDKVSGQSILLFIFTIILLGIACVIPPTNQFQKPKNAPVVSVTERPSNEVHTSFKPLETLTPFSSYSDSTSVVNHSHKNQGYEDPKPQPTHVPIDTIKTLTSESDEAVITILPSESASITTDPTLPSKFVEDYDYKRKKSRSLSLKRAHPKLAVKWHKIRHLWLDN